MYVLKPDYKTRITSDLLDKIIKDGAENGDDILETANSAAVDTISTLAGVLYDVSGEWDKAGTARNGLILTWALSIACYWLYQRIDDEEVPQKVIKNYEDVMETLENVSRGKFPLNLPPKAADGGGSGGEEGPEKDGTGLRRIGSRPPRTHII